ncbi:hypothetical protein G6O69_11930 [Pseudenhygromyxa sp. WMMC2535]|uniref:hypothetical protein n=1 Tax=Pseudenhygromyxa sp. WMMC2535 TaxID=2712867 RepID=UPI0015568272|nr:hypothetical protein [Pseudenhygromyxa sp. WMMC2535]NVB38541.1 hypothetical protein [Pseudenhygromyxa sp. WMMC2535]
MRRLSAPVALVLSLALPATTFAQQPLSAANLLVAPEEMSEEEKMEKAKELYIAAEGLAAEENWIAAVPLYEQAYQLVPGKHGFALKVGIAAYKIDDCDKAYDYLTHFVTYGDPEKYGDKIEEANGMLADIEQRQCRTTTAEPEPEPEPEPVADENPLENPLDQGGGGGTKDKKEKGKNGLLVGGAVMLGVGVVGLGLGGAGLGIAASTSRELETLASPSSTTGFSVGDYACRNDQPCPPDLEAKKDTWKVIGFVGLGVGGALAVTGVALIAVHASKKKKAAGASASRRGPQLTGLGPVLVPGGGAGASATLRF